MKFGVRIVSCRVNMKINVALYRRTMQGGKINFSIGLYCFMQPLSDSAEGSLIFMSLPVAPVQ